ncbi:corrinoid protein [Sporomusa sp.]|uniref:corrinoid protein n=1 Tax=Sporomusa sp. TaxID=2078658 RepID=UPI002CE1ABD5|nr:corrinoid protein [Sporomusa sp.]HWR44934.1 corrinoid protein [Sporomusa sp.]
MSVQEIFDAVLDLDEDVVVELVKKEIATGTDVSKILNEGLIGAMDEVGKRFTAGDLFVPEMLMAAQSMKAGLDELKPHLAQGATATRGAVIIGTVKGDLHDIGKNLVSMMMEGAGFEVFDVGMDVDTEKFLATAKEKNASIIAMSALLTTTMPAMEEVVKAIREQGLNLKTMIGGAPVTPAFAQKIGADAYCEDAPAAVEAARKFIA